MLIYDGVDTRGGLMYSRYDRNRVESVFKQAVGKEKEARDKHPPSRTFQMNLANGNMKGSLQMLKHSHNPNMIIAEKVQARTPLDRNTEPPVQSEADKYGISMIRHQEKPTWQKIDLPQSAGQEIGWLIAASATHAQMMAQKAQSQKSNPVGQARLEAYRTQSYSDLSAGELNLDGTQTKKGELSKVITQCRSVPQLPSYVPHLESSKNKNLPGETKGMRADAAMLNNPRFRKPKVTCALTDYADKYYAVMRHSPYNQAAARGGAVDRTSRD